MGPRHVIQSVRQVNFSILRDFFTVGLLGTHYPDIVLMMFRVYNDENAAIM